MKKIVALILRSLAALLFAVVARADVVSRDGVNTELISLMTNGPADKRINIVFVPEFYGNKRKEFVADVDLIKNALFEVEPFKSYRRYFNTSAIWMTFDRSPSSPMMYFCGYLDEAGYCNNWGGMDLSGNIVGRYYPIRNTAVVFLYYRGSSGFGGLNWNWPDVPIGYAEVDMGRMHDDFSEAFGDFSRVGARRSVVHEFGHAFADLGDENASSSLARRARGTELIDDGRMSPNLTFESRRDRIRWKHWIEPATPMPTPNTAVYRDKVGAFEGAGGYTYGIFRPMSACMMNTASPGTNFDRDPFCLVCREYLTKSIARFSDNLDTTTYTVGRSATTFRAKLISDVGRGFEVKWLVDGNVLASRVVASGADSLRVRENDIGFGAHTIRVEVRDTTSFVRYDPQNLLVESREWPVMNTPSPDFDGDGEVGFEDFFLFGDAFGQVVAENPDAARYDLDMDGEIGFGDFFLFADEFVG